MNVDYGDTRLPQRFWDKVYPEPNTGCWLWGGAVAGKPPKHMYGVISWGGGLANGGAVRGAHRVSYESLIGPIRQQIDHLCRQPPCVNPTHLEDVTSAENGRRGVAAETSRLYFAAITHCPRGHPKMGGNLILATQNGGRYLRRSCRTCRDDQQRERRQRRRAIIDRAGSVA